MNYRLQKKIRNALYEKELDDMGAQMGQTLSAVRGQFQKNSKKRRIGFWELLFSQIRFIGVRIWGIEILIVLFLTLFLSSFFKDFYFFTPKKMAFCLSCVTVIASMFALPFLYRSKRFVMMEIESATYFSVKRILLSRFLLFFGGEAVIMAGICTVAYVQQFVHDIMFIYMFLPFFLVCDGVLFFLQNTSPDKFCIHYACYGGALLLLFLTAYYTIPRIFDEMLPYPVLGVIVVLMCYFIYECVKLVKQPEEILY